MSFLTPSETAYFDQSLASVNEKLDLLIESYVATMDMTGIDAPEIVLMALSDGLSMITSHESCAELLALAIDRLSRSY